MNTYRAGGSVIEEKKRKGRGMEEGTIERDDNKIFPFPDSISFLNFPIKIAVISINIFTCQIDFYTRINSSEFINESNSLSKSSIIVNNRRKDRSNYQLP